MDKPTARTMTIEEIAATLGIGRTAAYTLAHKALSDPEHAPFIVIKLGGTIRVSRKSFEEFMQKHNM